MGNSNIIRVNITQMTGNQLNAVYRMFDQDGNHIFSNIRGASLSQAIFSAPSTSVSYTLSSTSAGGGGTGPAI